MAQNAQTNHLNFLRHGAPGEFRFNAAHSTKNGLFIDQGLLADGSSVAPYSYQPRNLTREAVMRRINATYAREGSVGYIAHWADKLQAHIVDFTAYKCESFGIWTRGDGCVVTGARLADNQVGDTFSVRSRAV